MLCTMGKNQEWTVTQPLKLSTFVKAPLSQPPPLDFFRAAQCALELSGIIQRVRSTRRHHIHAQQMPCVLQPICIDPILQRIPVLRYHPAQQSVLDLLQVLSGRLRCILSGELCLAC